jgi:hypothetical protein
MSFVATTTIGQLQSKGLAIIQELEQLYLTSIIMAIAKNLEFYNERPTNCYSIDPIDFDNFNDTIDGETLKSDAIFWLVRGQEVSLSHNQEDYLNAGIELKNMKQMK